MSKPLAAKGIGACLKHVLNTRLSPACAHNRGSSGHVRKPQRQCTRIEYGGRVRPSVHVLADDSMLRAAALPRIGEDDPLPPEDRVARAPLALEDLYRKHGPRLLRFFLRRTDRQDAGDLVHESFVRFANSPACRDRAVECPEAYLNQIATNLLRDRAKSALQRSLASHVPVDEVPLAGTDLVAALEARDKLNRLQNALMRLKPKTREIFLAHRLDGLSYRQISERSGLSIKGVEWHMTKAIDLLDRALRR